MLAKEVSGYAPDPERPSLLWRSWQCLGGHCPAVTATGQGPPGRVAQVQFGGPHFGTSVKSDLSQEQESSMQSAASRLFIFWFLVF